MKYKDIKGFPGYGITKTGLVLSICGDEIYTLTPRVNNAGYARVRLSGPEGFKELLVHRIVAIAYIPNPKGLRTVDHIDGNKLNNDVKNLRWLSHTDNMYAYHARKRLTKRNNFCYTVSVTINKGEHYGRTKNAQEEARP